MKQELDNSRDSEEITEEKTGEFFMKDRRRNDSSDTRRSSDRPYRTRTTERDRSYGQGNYSDRNDSRNRYQRSDRPYNNSNDNADRPTRRSFNPNFTEDNQLKTVRTSRARFGDNESDRGYKRNFERPSYNRDNNRSDNRSGYSRENTRPSNDSDRRFSRDNDRPYNRDNSDRNFNRNSDRPGYNRDNRSGNSYRSGYSREQEGSGENTQRTYSRPERSYQGERSQRSNDRPYNRERSQQSFSGDRPYNREGRSGDRSTGYSNNSYDRPSYNREAGGNTGNRYGSQQNNRYSDARSPRDGERRPGNRDRNQRYDRNTYDPRFDSRGNTRRTDNRYETPAPPSNEPVRLNRFIAQSGICSRREADEYIKNGMVTVNGTVITEMGHKVLPTDQVLFEGEPIQGEKKVYIIMNKPKGFVTTVEDRFADKTVIDLLKDQVKERVYPVGRLDKNTLGVLLLTNDGDLTKELTHPGYEKKKIYQVFLDKPISDEHLQAIADGVELEDGFIHADEISRVDNKNNEVGIELHSGRNRIVRRIFEHFGYKVKKLDRVYFAGLTKKGLQRGFWRHLKPMEISRLKSGSYE